MLSNLVPDNPLFYFFAILAIVFLLFFAIVFLIIFLFYEKSLSKLKQNEALVREEAYKKASEMLDEARSASLKIIGQSNVTAQESLKNATDYNQKAKDALETEIKTQSSKHLSAFERITAGFLNTFRGKVEEEKEKSLDILQETSKKVTSELVNEVESIKSDFEKETAQSREMLEKRLQEGYQKVDEELTQYQSHKMSQIDNNIYKIVVSVCKETIGETLLIEQHQDLVIKLLEDVKKRGGFVNE